MKCNQCGEEIADDSVFCEFCGMQQVKKKNSMGTTGFILALFGILLCWVPILNLILWTAGLVFSIIGICKRQTKKGLALTGLIISGISILILIAITAYYIVEYTNYSIL